jgi:hypothetical protein
MNSLLDCFLRLRLASSLNVDDAAVRERRISELKALLEEIAVPSCEAASDEDEGAHDRLQPSFS